jgi:hypothetical protein
MQTKSFIAILLVAVILVTATYSAYQFGNSSGYDKGQTDGYTKGQASSLGSSGRAYQNGYDAGFAAARNSTIP